MREACGRPTVEDSVTGYYRVEGPISLQSPAFLDMAREVLSRGQLFRFSAPGTSMSPIIRDGDVLTIAPIVESSFGIGDSVAFASPGEERLVVHRIVALREDGCITQGDNVSESDGIIPFDSILGIVVKVERDGTRIRAGLGPERVIIGWLSRWGYLRRFIDAGAPYVRTMRRLL